MPDIEWKTINGFQNRYAVSNDGRVWSLSADKQMKTKIDKCGYEAVCLYDNGRVVSKFVHRLVAETWIENKDELPQVNHKDENKTNNRVDNLEWVSAKENANHGTRKVRRAESVKHKKVVDSRLASSSSRRGKRIVQVSMDGRFVCVWNSISDVYRSLGLRIDGNLSRAIKKGKVFHGFRWECA